MTTVAFDGYSMVCDMQRDIGGVRDAMIYEDKIIIGSDFLIGFAGDWGIIQQWKRGIKIDKGGITASRIVNRNHLLLIGADNIEAVDIMVATKDGVYWLDAHGEFIRIGLLQYAIGSGADFAMGAMYHGATAYEACTIAGQLDTGTGDTPRSFAAPWIKLKDGETEFPF